MDMALDRAREVFEQHGGILRTTEAIGLGIAPRTLYALRDAEELRLLSRGVYQLSSRSMPSHPEYVVIARRLPRAVICLISALYFHKLTTQVPHDTYVAIPAGSPQPKLDFPTLSVVRLSGRCMTSGVETYQVDGETIRVYSVAKTVADCFRFRNKIGVDVAVEALQETLRNRRATPAEIGVYAQMNRVVNVMQPYFEALL
jgi:predicted transcriptional regulator of viral defense system